MSAQLRTIRRRITSVSSTAKITRAQELIATARAPKARAAAAAALPYEQALTQIASTIVSRHIDALGHPMLNQHPDASRVAILTVTSDRGFCGGLNSAVMRETNALVESLRDQGKQTARYLAGRSGLSWARVRDLPIVQEWSGWSATPTFDVARDIADVLLTAFSQWTKAGGVGAIYVVYPRFVSMLTQEPAVRRIMPIEIVEKPAPADAPSPPEYEYEPSLEELLDQLLADYMNTRIWQILLEAAAAEQAARQQAMRAATDNAKKLLETLSRQANQARQAEITNELVEIVSGANALAEQR